MENEKNEKLKEEINENNSSKNDSNKNKEELDKNQESEPDNNNSESVTEKKNINNDKSEEEKLMEEVLSSREEKLRLLAEMENLRKRIEREKIESIKFGSINLAREILSLGDNLERALFAIPKNEDFSQSIKNFVEGLKMVQKEFTTILQKNGVKKIDSLNNKFDHNFHQAITEIEKNDVEEGIVIQEIQTGYTMHDRLLRPAMVGVSKKPIRNKSKIEIQKEENKDQDKSLENRENKE